MRFQRRNRTGYGRGSGRKFGLRILLLSGLVLLALAWAYRKYVRVQLDKANYFLAQNDYDKAGDYFLGVAGLPLGRGKGHDGLGALALLRGDLEAAKSHFKVVLEQKPALGGDPALIFEKFLTKGLYQNGRIYRDFFRNWQKPETWQPFLLDFAAISLGVREVAEAREFLEQASSELKKSERHQALTRLADEYAGGKIPFLLDRRGLAMMVYDQPSGRYEFTSPKLFAGWSEDAFLRLMDLDEVDRLNRIHMTLDLNLQKAAFEAMRGFKGTLVLLDPKSGDILAALGTEGMDPFSTAFEPGSVIKVLTLGVMLENEGDLEPYAPKKYPGNQSIGGRIFYDWTTHGQLESVEEGMAVSCNLMFAQMGIDLGWPRLSQGFRRLFGDEAGAPLKGALYGSFVKEPENAWDLGRAAIGLDCLSATALGLAVVPGALGNRGELWQPSLFRQYANIEGVVYKEKAKQKQGRLVSEANAATLLMSMEAAMEAPRGTARRARVDFVQAAMKTGTAGERPFDSVMMGLFPVTDPKIAFGFFLSGGGKCEINGAKVAKQLQEQIKALAPSYLAP